MHRISMLITAVVAIVGIEVILFVTKAARGLADANLSYYFFSTLTLELLLVLLMVQARNRGARAKTR